MINQHTIFMYIDKDNIVIWKMHQPVFQNGIQTTSIL